jgi:hypothetical protein
MMMFDRHLSRELAAYVDGELTPSKTQEVRAHLTRCERCSTEFEQIRLGKVIVEHLPLVEAPESLWTSIQEALDSRKPNRTLPAVTWRFAWAAALILVASGVIWQLARRSAAHLEVVRLEGTPVVGSRRIVAADRMGVGEWIETDGSSRARIKVSEIGSVDVEPNTRVRLVVTKPGEHRLALRGGEITAKISAPPRLFFVETSSGTAVDLGCEYKLRSDEAGSGLLRVAAGWVSFEWKGRQSLVPAGATCRTRPRIGPGTPFFDDAPERLVRALETFDFANAGSNALSVVLAESRVRDTLTLWHLLSRAGPGERVRVYDRMARLSAPPGDISQEQILELDTRALNRWREELAWTW